MRNYFRLSPETKSAYRLLHHRQKHGWEGTGELPTFGKIMRSFFSSFWALLAPVIILGGIYAGIFTPTESAVVVVVYCLLIGVFVYKELDWPR